MPFDILNTDLEELCDIVSSSNPSLAWSNVRELANALEHAVILSDGEKVTPDDLPASLRTLIGAVEKALRTSSLGINPVVEGTLMRLPIPELNEERRRELTKVAGHYGEGARVAIRNVRRDGMDQIKKAKAEGMSEDEQKLYHDEIQELIAIPSAAAGMPLEQHEASIRDLGGNLPFFVQIACSNAIEQRLSAADGELDPEQLDRVLFPVKHLLRHGEV